MAGWFDHLGGWWLILAVVLAVAELVVPGVFLIFLAAAAAIMGVLAIIFPDMPIAVQLVGFAAWSAVAVLLGRRFYRDYPVETDDPLLNDRAARLIGETVTVTEAIDHGRGRVRVGDGEWPARGPDVPVGTRMRVVGSDGTALRVDALPPGIAQRE
ncbi:NfeD family protein [Sphingomonas sp.]|uniref:NfeD family protein n=1 Tax=Sphingomonas sp. TaxID=28214 RepID=UPI002BEBB8E5|nr:NfeD family protein [Sphingomonas sp.]HWK36243.1 NfeD family protein [Sphingomonas sp.]